jgi:hypothetical protein
MRQNFSDSPTYSEWFERFNLGCHKPMGDDIHPGDPAVTIEVMLTMQAHYEHIFSRSHTSREQLKIALHCCFFLVLGFCTGLRGEELPLMSLDAIRKYFDKPQKANLAHVMLGLPGRIKGEFWDQHCHLVPIVAVTQSGMRPREWVLGHVAKNTSHILVDYPSNISQKKGILKIKNPTLAAQCNH